LKYSKLIPALFFIFSVNLLFSQVKLSAGPSIGLTAPSSDYSGTTIDYYNGVNYGLSSGVNFGAILKIKLAVIRIRAGLNYASLKNSGNSEPDKPNSFVETKQSMFTVFAGPEFSFSIPASPIVPYAGIDLLLTSFSGETSFQGVSRVPSGTYSMSGSTRFGLGLGAGIEFHFANKYAVDLGIRYNLNNLFGKKFEELPSDERIDSYVNLNDEQDPNYSVNPDKHPIRSSRSISVIQINVAFLFDF